MGDAAKLLRSRRSLLSTNIHLAADTGGDVVLFYAALIVFPPEEIIICHLWEIIRKSQQLRIK